MDREKLFKHLEKRYFSKRDMITRIPLGAQTDEIWQELQNRRRAKSTVLPLNGSNGMPFWYVTTDKMISASEKIVEELFENETEFDPYMDAPAVATLEEVFYTSYVDGSTMTMQEAMDYLQSDMPPRSVEEQMIVNNRNAGSFASSNLFRGIIWDEFTEYVLHSEDITILQQLSEFSKEKPLYWMFIVHKSQEMIQNLTDDRYQLITHRFHQVEFHISTDAAYDLIAGSIKIRNGMSEHWAEARKPVINNIRRFLPEMAGLDDKIIAQIEHMCPMHPMTIKLLSRVAENYAASQRTMFRFMKDQATPDLGFVGFIHQNGPDDQANWLTPDWLWDYFFTRESDFSDKETKVPEYIRHFEESRSLVEGDENAFRIFKTALLLMAVMSSTKGMNVGKKTKDGISATEDCLDTCLAGVIDKAQIHDLLETMQDSKILVLDKDFRGNVQLQLPFSKMSGDEFPSRLAANDKKYSRYRWFS